MGMTDDDTPKPPFSIFGWVGGFGVVGGGGVEFFTPIFSFYHLEDNLFALVLN